MGLLTSEGWCRGQADLLPWAPKEQPLRAPHCLLPGCTLTFQLQQGLAGSTDIESFIWRWLSVSASAALAVLVGCFCLPARTALPCWSQFCPPLPCYLTLTGLQNKHRSRSYEQVFIC